MRARPIYARVVSADFPERELASLTNADLEELLVELMIENPNEFQSKIYVMAMVAVLVRWKKLIRL